MRDRHYYILDGHTPVAVTIQEWAKHNAEAGEDDRRVGLDKVGTKEVSTVFLGINHNWFDEENPILFETMIFNEDGSADSYQERYHTWDEALTGHNDLVREMRRKARKKGTK